VFVAHSGRRLSLRVTGSTRVTELHNGLETLTGLRPADQIVMLNGQPLDKMQPLSYYGLPSVGTGSQAGVPGHVYLYSRAHLRAGAAAPAPETLPSITLGEPGVDIEYEPHPLDNSSPLIRALPMYERDFRGHALRAKAFAEAGRTRLLQARQLLLEMDIQCEAIEVARSNVEHHYIWIQEASATFMRKYRIQAASHEEVLRRFERDMDRLKAAELHPAARTGSATHLMDLVPENQLRNHHTNCVHAHKQFADKVAALAQVFRELKADVEALFMAVPPSDPEQLAAQARDMQLQLDEQESIAAAMEQDFKKVQELVDEALHAMSSHPSAASVGPLDAAGVMDAMNASHVHQLLPRLLEGDAVLTVFTEHCLDCKNQMTQEVLSQLRIISAQQSKIGQARDKLRMFGKVANRQSEAIDQLQLPRRVPTAYRQCLAECMRRSAFAETYALTAGKLAEQMAKVRAEEVAARDDFRAAVDRFVPNAVINALGLTARPPHCDISVPSPDAGLADIQPTDLEDVPAFDKEVKMTHAFGGETPRSAGASPRGGSASLPASEAAAVAAAAAAAAVAEGQDDDDLASSLQMENARLRAEVARLVAMACVTEQKALTAAVNPPDAPPPPPLQRRASDSESSPTHSERVSPPEPPSQRNTSAVAAISARFNEALAAKDDVASRLDKQLRMSRQQAAAYVIRIKDLEAALESRSVMQAPPLSGPSPNASSHSAASVCSPAWGLAPPTTDDGGGRAPKDAVQRAATGSVIAPSGDRPPRSPQLPPLSPRSAAAGSFTMVSSSNTAMPPPLSLDAGPPPQMDQVSPRSAPQPLPAAGQVGTTGTSPTGAVSPSGSPTSDAAALTAGGLSRQLAAAAGHPSAVSGEAEQTSDAAGVGRPLSAVVTLPSFTSLAESAAAAAGSSDDIDEAPSASGVASSQGGRRSPLSRQRSSQLSSDDATDQQSSPVSGGSPPDPAATSGFRVTGFRVPSSELGESLGASSGAAGGGIPILEPAGGSRRRPSFEAGYTPSTLPSAAAAAAATASATIAAAAATLSATPFVQHPLSGKGSPASSGLPGSALSGAADFSNAVDHESAQPLPLPLSPPEVEPASRAELAAMSACLEKRHSVAVVHSGGTGSVQGSTSLHEAAAPHP